MSVCDLWGFHKSNENVYPPTVVVYCLSRDEMKSIIMWFVLDSCRQKLPPTALMTTLDGDGRSPNGTTNVFDVTMDDGSAAGAGSGSVRLVHIHKHDDEPMVRKRLYFMIVRGLSSQDRGGRGARPRDRSADTDAAYVPAVMHYSNCAVASRRTWLEWK